MTRKEPLPVLPGPDCATIAPLLPMLDSYDLSDEEAARAREHLRGCDWCVREYAAHTIVRDALRRHYGEPSRSASPFLTMEHIVNDFDTQDNATRLATAYPPTDLPTSEFSHHPRRGPSRFTGIAAVAAAVLLIGLAAGLFAMLSRASNSPAHGGPSTATATTTQQPPTPLHLPAGANLLGIAMASPNDGWAVGMTADRKTTLLLHYHDGQWSIWPGVIPNQVMLLLSGNSLSMTSATDSWITGVGATLHYSNNQWVAVPLPGVGAVSKVDMASSTEGWAEGFIQTPDKQSGSFGMLRYHNGSWSIVTLPQDLQGLRDSTKLDFSVTASGECWLMYRDASGTTEILRSTGNSFQVAYTLPGVKGQHITMHSSQDGWLTGKDASGNVLYHFDGSQWTKAAIPASLNQQSLSLDPVVISPSGEAWLPTGNDAGTGPIARYRNGSWEVLQVLSAIVTYTFTPVADDEGWAIGAGGNSSALYHYQNGHWTQYPN